MKQFKRLTSFLLALLTVFCTLPITTLSVNIDDATKVESYLGSEYKDKQGKAYTVPNDTTYFIFNGTSIVGTGVTKKDSVKRKLMIRDYYKTDDTRQVLCIEAGVPFGSYVSDYKAESGEISNYLKTMGEAKKILITSACFCGWQPGRTAPYSDCNEDDYAIATQIIIWEIQQGLRTSATEINERNPYVNGKRVTVPADAYYGIIKGRAAEKCYNYILQKMAKHGKTPSFSAGSAQAANSPITLKYDAVLGKYKASVTDTNNSGEDIKLVGNVSHYATHFFVAVGSCKLLHFTHAKRR